MTYDFFPRIGGIGSLTHTLYGQLRSPDTLFFSPARNSLPGHIRIGCPGISTLKQGAVSIWLLFNGAALISRHRLEKLNIHAGPGGVLYLRKLPIPVIITCHHTYWQQYTHIGSQFWKRIFLPLERRTYRLADSIVCDCHDTRKVLIRRYGITPEKIGVIQCAVETERFHPLDEPREPHSLLYVGRISKRKGIDLLIRSIPLVLKEVPGARLLVAGKGEQLKKMKELVRKLGLESSVTFLGFVPDGELNRLYNQAVCAVVPSIFEGFGISVIEALAAGTRVVGTDVDGIREILSSGEYGRLVPYGDTTALAEAMIAELMNPQRAGELRPEYRVELFRQRYDEIFQGK